MAAIEGADESLGMREFGFDQFDDTVGGFGLLDADEDGLGIRGAGSAQHVEPRAVAVVDLEAEVSGGRIISTSVSMIEMSMPFARSG